MTESSSNLRHKSSPLDGPRKFYKDSLLFLQRCTKPDRRGTLLIILFYLILFYLSILTTFRF